MAKEKRERERKRDEEKQESVQRMEMLAGSTVD